MSNDQRNLFLAIALSLAILLGFQFLIPEPAPQQPSPAQTTGAEGVAGDRDLVGVDTPGLPGEAAVAGHLGRGQALDESPRVEIRNPRVHGSIALDGARIDDLTLTDYRETVDPTSPEIVLLSPREAPHPYYADFGWAAADQTLALPSGADQWTSDGQAVEPGQPVTLRWDNGAGLVFEREIAVDENYMFSVTQRVANSGEGTVSLSPFGRILRFGTPAIQGFFILHEGPYGVFDGTLDEYDYDDIRDDGRIEHTTTGGWLGFTDKYWLVALIPDQATPVIGRFDYRFEGGDRYYATFLGEARAIAPGETIEVTHRLFAGAKEVELVDRYENDLGITQFDLTIDFGWFYFLTKPFFFALAYIDGVVGNFGIAILIFTVAIKLVFFPLANKSYKSMSKMKALQPQMLEIRDRHKEDRQKMNMEMMALYKREKVNPASGCLPILVQIPVFFALYKVLFVTIEMRHAPFFGWIQDLSAPDPTTIFNLFGLIPWTPPEILTIGIWPLLMGLSMFAQQKLNPAPADPLQAKIFMLLPIVFTVMLARFPAGLVIYWTWNNLLSILQQWIIMKRMGVKIGGGVVAQPPAPAAAAASAGAAAAGGNQEDKEPEAATANKGRKAAAGRGAKAADRDERDEKPAAGGRGAGRTWPDAGGSAASRRRAAQSRGGGSGDGKGKGKPAPRRGKGQRKPR